MNGITFNELEGLTSLLGNANAEEELAPSPHARSLAGPGSIPVKIDPNAPPAVPAVLTRGKVKDPKEIWDVDELPDHGQLEEEEFDDGRAIPDIEYIYKQAIGVEDAYLGMDPTGPNPSSTSCETLVCNVSLPGTTSMAEIQLDVTQKSISVLTPQYKLRTYLPHEVRDKDGRAEWLKDMNVLRVTLPIVRPLYDR